jgi:hypothetical protein
MVMIPAGFVWSVISGRGATAARFSSLTRRYRTSDYGTSILGFSRANNACSQLQLAFESEWRNHLPSWIYAFGYVR